MASKKKRAAKKSNPTFRGEGGAFGNRGTAFTAEWLALAGAYGGVTSLANAIGVSYSTLHRWAVNGDAVPEAKWRWVSMMAATKGLEAPAKKKVN